MQKMDPTPFGFDICRKGADSIHGLIGKRMKKRESILNFDDFVELCRGASSKILSIVLEHKNFFKFVSGCRARSTRSNSETLPLIHELCEVKFVRNINVMMYKNDFSEADFSETSFIRVRYNVFDLPCAMSESRGITSKKKAGIINAMKKAASPADSLLFWTSLPEDESVPDLVTTRE